MKDNITPEETADYLAKLNEMDDHDGYILTYHGKNDESSSYKAKSSGRNPIYAALPIVLLVGGVVWWTQRRQQG